MAGGNGTDCFLWGFFCEERVDAPCELGLRGIRTDDSRGCEVSGLLLLLPMCNDVDLRREWHCGEFYVRRGLILPFAYTNTDVPNLLRPRDCVDWQEVGYLALCSG